MKKQSLVLRFFALFYKSYADADDDEDDTDCLDDEAHRDWLSEIRHLLPLHSAHIHTLRLQLGTSSILDILLLSLLRLRTRRRQL